MASISTVLVKAAFKAAEYQRLPHFVAAQSGSELTNGRFVLRFRLAVQESVNAAPASLLILRVSNEIDSPFHCRRF